MYDSHNPVDIINQSLTPKIKGPGPAFHCSYDNKYNEESSYAHDKGRVKLALNTNKHDEKLLKTVEKPEYQAKLKNSSIKFDQHEFKQPLMDREETNSPNLSPGMLREIDSPTFNKVTKEPHSTHFADHNTGGVSLKERRQKTLVHRDNYSVSSGSPMNLYSIKKANSFFSGRNSL